MFQSLLCLLAIVFITANGCTSRNLTGRRVAFVYLEICNHHVIMIQCIHQLLVWRQIACCLQPRLVTNMRCILSMFRMRFATHHLIENCICIVRLGMGDKGKCASSKRLYMVSNNPHIAGMCTLMLGCATVVFEHLRPIHACMVFG